VPRSTCGSTLRGHRRRLRASRRSALRGQEDGSAARASRCSNWQRFSSAATTPISSRKSDVENRRRPHTKVHCWRPAPKPAVTERALRRSCRSSTRSLSIRPERSTVIRKMRTRSSAPSSTVRPTCCWSAATQIYNRTGVRPMTDGDGQDIVAAKHGDGAASLARARLGLARSGQRVARRPHCGRRGARSRVRWSIGMYDPPRHEAKEAVATCAPRGIRVVMITGDHPRTATAIARELGTASDDDLAIAGVELDRCPTTNSASARLRSPCTPASPRRTNCGFIRALKANDAVVAMTGDGVKRCPAIKAPTSASPWGKRERKSPSSGGHDHHR